MSFPTPYLSMQILTDPDSMRGATESLLQKEWLIANGLGGYASSTPANVPTRKYHGLLVSSLPEYGRTVMLAHLIETFKFPDGREILLGNIEYPEENLTINGIAYLNEFFLEMGLPVWRYNFEGYVLEKRMVIPYMQNSIYMIYQLLSGKESNSKESIIQVHLTPFFNFRSMQLPASTPVIEPYKLTIMRGDYEIAASDAQCKNIPTVKINVEGNSSSFVLNEKLIKNVFFRKEAARGEQSIGDMWSPGSIVTTLPPQGYVSFGASSEGWDSFKSLTAFQALEYEKSRRAHLIKRAPPNVRKDFGAELVLAADQFIIVPASRVQDKVRARATGDQVRTITAGYHWFADWGRDTMISLEGLTLCTGRYEEACWILRTFAFYVRNGLIPNMFPDGANEGLYHTADASLWFFHAVHRYMGYCDDRETLQFILPKLLEIFKAHLRGTLFGIRMDPEDGLLTQGAEGYQLTWMDAKVEDWVVTPRRGKAVEINALWYNALCLLIKWLKEEKKEEIVPQLEEIAQKVYHSFNRKFWNEEKGYLFDVIEGERGSEDALRPNQIFAISLDYPVLEKRYWAPVFEKTQSALLTPLGLRSLAPGHPDFKSHYMGDLRSRDSAYHQGTVWSWLIGPYVDAWLKVAPDDKKKAHDLLRGFRAHLLDAGIGFISEIFDASEPYTARGCIAQAWSIAELLRTLIKTI